MADLSVVVEKLHSFETADDLAEFFRGYGIQAQPRRSDTCAITKFVIEETGLSGRISTSPVILRFYNVEEDGSETAIESFDHTAAMMQFVVNYDKGHYPYLIEAGYELSEDD